MAGRNSSRIYNHAELEAEIQKVKDEAAAREGSSFKKSKHSLDSDEEDEEETSKKYNVLDPNEMEGQEEGTIDYDGEIKITPFNMKEELEEGYFDKEGTYIFNKETELIKDQWLDDIDWVKVKAVEGTKRKQASETDSDEELPSLDLTDHYKRMLELMKPGETVQKAICRLGGSSNSSRSASNRWKKKKDKEETSDENADKENYEKLQLLTRLADDIIQSGNMDIYQQTYEKLSFHVNLSSNGSKDVDSALDMFGEDFEEKVDETKSSSEAAESSSQMAKNASLDEEVMWEYKWEDSEDSKIYGPFSTSQMLQWVNEKYFEDGVFVRQCNKPDSKFYTSKRIDFELYL